MKEGYACTDLGWSPEGYRKAIETLCEADLIGYDSHEQVVRLSNFFTFDPFTNINHAKGTIKIALSLPDCLQKSLMLNELYQQKFVYDSPALWEAIERLSKAYRTPEPERERERETERERDKDSSPAPLSGALPPTKGKRQKKQQPNERSTQIPKGWTLTDEYESAAFEIGITDKELQNEAKKFHEYWSGSGAKKSSWLASWKSWCTRTVEYRTKNQRDGAGRSERVSKAVRAAGLQGRDEP